MSVVTKVILKLAEAYNTPRREFVKPKNGQDQGDDYISKMGD